MKRRIIFVVLILLLVIPNPLLHLSFSYAEQCSNGTCIDVSTDGAKEVVITVRKGKPGASSTTRPRPKASSPRVKRPWIPYKPRPAVKRTPSPRPKASVARISSTAVMDQVRSLLPTGVIMTQPTQQFLTHQPITFMTNIPPRFVASLMVLRIPITIDLQATYIWSFGDGSSLITQDPGKPYPLATISHSYESSGAKNARLEVKWNGTWRAAGMSAPINGGITQVYTRELLINGAAAAITR